MPATGMHRALPVPDGLEGQRVDQALSRLFGLSRTAAAEVADAGSVLVDGRVRGKGDRLTGGAGSRSSCRRRPGEPVAPRPVEGMTSCTTTTTSWSSTSRSAWPPTRARAGTARPSSAGWPPPATAISTSGAAERQGVVHRLDAATTGVMVVAKSERAYTALKAAFKERTVAKRYHALVQGHPDPSRGTIDAPIDRHPKHDWRFAVVSGGRPSVTHYEVLEAFRAASLVDVQLETGRTHQIRVHFSALRHPCVGDMTYGADPTLAARLGVERQWLHAVRLGFAHPDDGRWVEFASDYPPDLAGALAVLRAEA